MARANSSANWGYPTTPPRSATATAAGALDAEHPESEVGGAIEVRTGLTQQDLADWIGVSRDAVVIALRRLRDAGVLETGRLKITLHDLEVLRTAATNL